MIFDEEKVIAKNKEEIYLFEKEQKQVIEKLSVEEGEFNKVLMKEERMLTQQSDTNEKEKVVSNNQSKIHKKNTMSFGLDQNEKPYELEEESIKRFTELIGSVEDSATGERIERF